MKDEYILFISNENVRHLACIVPVGSDLNVWKFFIIKISQLEKVVLVMRESRSRNLHGQIQQSNVRGARV